MISKVLPSEQVKIIDKNARSLKTSLTELTSHQDLLWLFVKRDFISFYKQTILGPIWFFLQPIFTTTIYFFLFYNLAKLSTDGLPGVLFYLSGITLWSFFSELLLKTSGLLRENAAIFGKVYFPRLIVPISHFFSGLLKLSVQLFLLAAVSIIVYFFVSPFNFTAAFFLIPFIILLTAIQSCGLGLMIASLSVKYRDIALLMGFFMQGLMYSTTVIYPLSSTSGILNKIVLLNPMTSIIESFRFCLFNKGTVIYAELIYTIIFSCLVLYVGLLMFIRTEKDFVDTI